MSVTPPSVIANINTIIVLTQHDLDLEGDVPISLPDEWEGNEERAKMIFNCLPSALQLKY